ncbi:MAG: DUF3037 domain-containing protein [Terracidiphilus sp.]|jgi:hypothetical protein
MNQDKGYYSLIQFCPDPSRLEGVNIGIVVYSSSEKRVRVRITKDNRRIKKVFGNQDWRLLNRAKASIESQLQSEHFVTIGDLEAYIAKRANIIQLTAPRSVRITDLETVSKELQNRLVGPDLLERKHRIEGDLRKRFFEAGVVDLVQKSVNVEVPDLKKSIRVPYAYQNGRFNLISPVQFDDPETISSKIGKSAIEGQLLYSHLDPNFGEMRLVVVANFEEQIVDSTREFVKRTLIAHSVTVYSFEDLRPLVDDIRQSAAAHSS